MDSRVRTGDNKRAKKKKKEVSRPGENRAKIGRKSGKNGKKIPEKGPTVLQIAVFNKTHIMNLIHYL
jgi:hypothetical protein